MDPVILLVGLYRVAGSLPVLRWPFWGGIAAVACDLLDLLAFNLFVVYGGWSGFDGYRRTGGAPRHRIGRLRRL